MSDPKNCPNCGAELGPDAPDGLCPSCLMENAAWSQTVALPDDAALTPTLDDSSAPQGAPHLPVIQPEGSDFGGYRILRLLGRGGMGAVYEAEQAESGRRVALKVLSHKLDSEDARKRFIREGRLAASINHPNSVYVFGTEEIEGTPAIAMEIVPGGTLQEKVAKEGPLGVPQAVDAILQIVAGLESAQSIGILHRDVKPSNCFVDEHGVAKIGDFGLSISTEGRGDSHLTIQGSLLGTPAFSSPEQLRGDELNTRSDMYSVGATLFYLLTGHAPFEEGNMVKLLSRVLEETPPDPTSLRPDIPRRLARVILRCLAKTPADRLKSYADLRKALEPFSSESPSPATLALRFGAYLIDTVVLGSLLFPLQALAWGSVAEVFNQGHIGTTKFYLVLLVVSLLMALYFGLMEGLRGASLGKQLVRLRLQRQDGSLPGFPRAFLRAAVLIAIMSGPYWTITILWADLLAAPQSWVVLALTGITNIVSLVVLFWAARRHNGYAGLHGRASDTRVVRALATTKRPPLMLGDPSDSDPQEGAEALGPYHVIEPLGTSGSGRWFLAYDTKLLRRVWVHSVTPETPAVPPSLRNLNRHGRLRWITGRRSEDENWDAYEAPGGKALSALAGTPQSWAAVRFWLLDLAGEFKAAQADGTTPAILSFDRVWITADGHAKLLDFPAPNADVESTTHEDPAAFLRAIGDCTRQTKPPLPGHARALLSPDGPQNCAEILEILRLSVRRPTHISRLRRSFISLSVSALPFLTIFFGILFMALIHKVQESNPKLTDLSSTTLAIQLSKNNEERGHLRRYLAHHYRQIVEDPATWRQMEVNLIIDLGRQQIAKDAVAAYPSLTPDEITAAEAIAGPLVKDNPAAIQNLPPIAPLIMVLAMWITTAALPSLFMALIMRRGLVLVIFGTVVVNSVGEQASRGRALWRSIIVWSPFPVVAILTGFLAPLIGATALMILVGAAVLILTIYSHLRKGRSLPDRLAGTWLVPK